MTRTRKRAENASGKRSVWDLERIWCQTLAGKASGKRSVWDLDRIWCKTLAGKASGKRSVWNLDHRRSARHYPFPHASTANV
ncbi:hypothetical protein KUV50_07430 [Membranicola marinus]|uniref:Uncharacterized protein n=1 Tax=Membranihabitans marinus TaxID=1227546 RepID=A0A953HL67_9BACT|nr:hypothetical protein [Membranihabitans marinus]MBY5957954.1 hypothetical protein [Membranihabitans marinus]